MLEKIPPEAMEKFYNYVSICHCIPVIGSYISYRPIAADIINLRIRKRTPTWWLFSIFGDSSFYCEAAKAAAFWDTAPLLEKIPPEAMEKFYNYVSICHCIPVIGSYISYRPIAADIINLRIRKRTPTWWLFSIFGDSSFYCDLGKHNHAPTVLPVCVESDKMWLLLNAYHTF